MITLWSLWKSKTNQIFVFLRKFVRPGIYTWWGVHLYLLHGQSCLNPQLCNHHLFFHHLISNPVISNRKLKEKLPPAGLTTCTTGHNYDWLLQYQLNRIETNYPYLKYNLFVNGPKNLDWRWPPPPQKSEYLNKYIF